MKFRDDEANERIVARKLSIPKLVIPKHGDTWGPWQYNATQRTLQLKEGDFVEYEVYLEECGTSAELCDWIFQVAKKKQSTTDLIGNLVRALNALLDPQANLCSWGRSKKMNVRRHLAREKVLGLRNRTSRSVSKNREE